MSHRKKSWFKTQLLLLFIFSSFVLIGASSHTPYQDIIAAVKKGSLSEVQRALIAGKNLNLNEPINDEVSLTILHIAAGKYGNFPDSTAICRALITAGADKNALDIDAFTPLSHAIYYSNKPVIQTLLQAGADPNKGAAMGDALRLATEKGQLDIIELLISAKVDVKGKKGGSALSLAAQNGNIEIIKELIRAGASLKYVDSANNTALHSWSHNGTHDLEALRLLLSNGANVNAPNKWKQTPIMLMLTSENDVSLERLLPALKILIEAGADLMTKSDYGDSAMSLGLRNSRPEVVELIKAATAK